MTDKTPTSRRTFLKGGLAAGGALAAAPALAAGDPAILEVQPWANQLGEGVDVKPYGTPSPYEAHVRRRNVPWLTADPVSSINFTPLHELDGVITPNGLCFERHHSGVAEVDPAKYRLMINGLVERELVFTMEDLKRFPRENRAYFLECAANSGMEWRGAQLNGCQFTHGMIHNVIYTGIPLKTILEEAGLKTNAKWIMPEGADAAAMTRSVPIEKAHHREETSKYTDLMANGKARRFTWEMDAKSVITNPSPQAPILHGKGKTIITGVAWSGRGTIKEVHVTLDGGRNWQQARIDGPSWDKSMHRFYYEFDWDGSPLLLQSRAVDSTGYVQPTKNELRAVRGENSIYHNNGIQTWHVTANGEAENVEVS